MKSAKSKIRIGTVAARRKSASGIRKVGARAGASGRVVYERTTCCWTIRQSASQIRA